MLVSPKCVCVSVFVFLFLPMSFVSPVSGVACVAQRARPDCRCSNWNGENFGLPAAWIHSYGRAACVSPGWLSGSCLFFGMGVSRSKKRLLWNVPLSLDSAIWFITMAIQST